MIQSALSCGPGVSDVFGIPIPSGRTMGAMDTEPDAVPHYGSCIDDLYHTSRTHLGPATRALQPNPTLTDLVVANDTASGCL